jgi:adenine phosphoribosyltransferase
MKTYTLSIGPVTRELPIVPVSKGLSIASFVMLGDTALIEAAADALVCHSRFPKSGIDLLVCPEAKAIPLTHAVAVRLGLNYVVVRKSVKAYMQDPLVESVSSITTAGTQSLVLDGPERSALAGKRVCIVDDVVSTGGSLRSLERLLAKTGCTIVAKAAVLLESGGYSDDSLVYLQILPVFSQA